MSADITAQWLAAVQARARDCRDTAQLLRGKLQALISELPSENDAAEGSAAYALQSVRSEMECAADYVKAALDYLTPRSDDDDPDCCAHRKLRRQIAIARGLAVVPAINTRGAS